MANIPTAEGVQKLKELLKDFKLAMLTTVCQDGGLHSRPMATQKHEFDGDLWFFTRDDSPKTDEIRRAQKVNITYTSPQSHRFVSVSGVGEIVKDRAKFEEFWDPKFETWFSQGIDDPHLSLLKVHVESAAYWDSPGGPTQQVKGFQDWETKKLKLA